jgi:hypothetical protein
MKNKQPEPPPFVRPQNWGDKRPVGMGMKKAILNDINKTMVIVGKVKVNGA